MAPLFFKFIFSRSHQYGILFVRKRLPGLISTFMDATLDFPYILDASPGMAVYEKEVHGEKLKSTIQTVDHPASCTLI